MSFASAPTSTIQRFSDPDLSMKNRIEIIEGYNDFVQSKVNAGWSVFLITFMYRPLSGNYLSKLHQMKGSIERLYSRLLTRLVRYPSKSELPILIGMADFPVPKRRKKSSVMDVIINDGLHFHSILLIPPKSRLRTSLEKHLEENAAIYLGSRRTIDRIDLKPITRGNLYALTDYVFKSIRRGFSYNEHVLILPRAFSECARRSPAPETPIS